MSTATQALRHARGKRYGELIHVVWDECIDSLCVDCDAVKARGAVSPVAVARLALKYDLSYKVCCLFLEERHRLPAGTYDRIAGAHIIMRAFELAK